MEAAAQARRAAALACGAARPTTVIRAFSYFSHLANIAEDLHPLQSARGGRRRNRRAEPRQQLRPFAQGLDRRRKDRAGAVARLDLAGAHRPSDGSAAQEPARRRARHLRSARGARACRAARRELARNEVQLRARVSQLWQTELLRHSRLTVRDEIDNTLSYYRSTFLRRNPRCSTPTSRRARAACACLPSCAWALGSAATATAIPMCAADSLANALRMQGETALRFYLVRGA